MMKNDVTTTFEKFSTKKKRISEYAEKESRLKDRANKRKQKTQNRNYNSES